MFEILLAVEISCERSAREADERRLIVFERAAKAHCGDAFRRVPARRKVHRHARKPRPVGQHLPAMLHPPVVRSEEHTSELQSLMSNSYAVFCLKKKKNKKH